MLQSIAWVFLAAQLAGAAPPSPAVPLQLTAVEITGTRRYVQGDVVRLSGLEPGKSVTAADFDAATKRLAATGLFKEIGYRYATVAGRTTVTFTIDEADWTMPVVFDNFVWFTDEEIVAALRQRIPSFDGTAPILAGTTEFITQELQAFLQAKQIAGRVEFLPQATPEQGILAYMFRVRDPAPRACALRFTGASAIKESELIGVLDTVVGSEYSRSSIVNTARGTLTDMYRQRGHWRASIGTPTAVVESGQACSGVSVTVPVQEGSAYTIARIEWSGNTSITTRDLDALMPVKAGAIASGPKLEEGLLRVRQAYGKQGYLALRADLSPHLDDEKQRAVFDVKIDEGPQFRFGTLTFPGLAPDGAAILAKRWRLKQGEVFDATYPSQFYADEIQPRLRGTMRASIKTQVDQENRVVNIGYVFGR